MIKLKGYSGIRLIVNKLSLVVLFILLPFPLLGEIINPNFGLPYDGEGQGETFCSNSTGESGLCPENIASNRLLFHNYFHFESNKISYLRIDGEFISKAEENNNPLFEQVFEEWKGSTVSFSVYTTSPYNNNAEFHCLKLSANSQALPRTFGKLADNNFTVPSAIGNEPLNSPIKGVAFKQFIILGGKNTTITSVIDSQAYFETSTTSNVLAVLSDGVHIDHYSRMWATNYQPSKFKQPNITECDVYILTDNGELIQSEQEGKKIHPERTIKNTYPGIRSSAVRSYFLAARYGIEIPMQEDL